MSDHKLNMIKNLLKMFSDTSIVLETSKKIVICCPDDIEARGLLRSLHNLGHTAALKKGLKTDRYYVAVY